MIKSQLIGARGKVWPVCSDPTDELLLFRLVSKLILVLTEGSQYTQCITVLCEVIKTTYTLTLPEIKVLFERLCVVDS